MQFTIEDCDWVKIMDKKIARNIFRQKMKSYWVKDTDRQISVCSLTLVIFAAVWADCGRP